MIKLAIPDFVKAIAEAFKAVVETRFVQHLAKGATMSGALKGLAQVTTSGPGPFAVATPSSGPPSRGNGRG